MMDATREMGICPQCNVDVISPKTIECDGVRYLREPSVDWLDPARESCLIDGVRYTKRWVTKKGSIYTEYHDEGAARGAVAYSEQRYKIDGYEVLRILVPIDQHPPAPVREGSDRCRVK